MRGITQYAATASIRDQHVRCNDVRVEIEMIGDDCALQTVKDAGVALERIKPTVISDNAGGESGVETEVGADVQYDGTLGQKGPENADHIGFMLPPENITERLESRSVDTDVFPGGEPYERPIGSNSDRADRVFSSFSSRSTNTATRSARP